MEEPFKRRCNTHISYAGITQIRFEGIGVCHLSCSAAPPVVSMSYVLMFLLYLICPCVQTKTAEEKRICEKGYLFSDRRVILSGAIEVRIVMKDECFSNIPLDLVNEELNMQYKVGNPHTGGISL